MIKTTVYLPESIKRRLRALARQRGTSEAQLIREGVERVVALPTRRPQFPLFDSGDPTLWMGSDKELLAGFGER